MSEAGREGERERQERRERCINSGPPRLVLLPAGM